MTDIYKIEPVSDISTVQDLLSYLRRELDKIEASFSQVQLRIMDELHAEPTRLRDGLTVFADGTDWNPGSGQGVYTYYAAAWHKLG